MRTSGWTALVCLPLLLVACKGGDKDGGKTSASASSRSIKGVVNDPFGQPIAGASVSADGGEPVITDGDGTFSVGYDKRKPQSLTVSKSGYTEHASKFPSDGMKPIELVPVPPKDGIFLIGPKALRELEMVPLSKGEGTTYHLTTAEYVKLPIGVPLRFILKGTKVSAIKEVPPGDPVAFGPGMTLNPVTKTLAVSGGGELTIQSYGAPAEPERRWALANFSGPDNTPEGDRAVLFSLE